MAKKHLSASSALVLQAVAEGSRYGFDIMDRTGLPSGTVYPALRRLERDRLIRSCWEAEALAHRAKRPRRRYYQLTVTGRVALQGARDRYPWLDAASAEGPPGAEPSQA